MAFNDQTRLWVIFDTCTRREYYQDVHNLIAVPYGSVLRYEYKDRHMSAAALEAARNPDSAPSKILLVYAQWNKYERGGSFPPMSTPSSEILWVPTRIGEMLLIPPPEGENFFFDFKVLSYPAVDDALLSKLLAPRIAAEEVPYKKWICLSDDLPSFASMQRGKDGDNWQAIVNKLGEWPMQFAQDYFLRLKGPFDGSSLIKPTYVRDEQENEGKLEVRSVSSEYNVSENSSISLEVISHSPSQPSEMIGKPRKLQRKLEVQSDDKGPISVLKNSFDLREYTGFRVEFKAKPYEELEAKQGLVSFVTALREDGWPIGANFPLKFRVTKKTIRIVLAIISGVVAAAALLLVKDLWGVSKWLGGAAALVGVVAAIITSLLLTRKLAFKT